LLDDDASSSSRDAPSAGLQLVDFTATSEDRPLGDVVRDMDEEKMPAEVFNIFGKLADLIRQQYPYNGYNSTKL